MNNSNNIFERIKPEPFKIHSVSPIEITSKEERAQIIKEVGYNTFKIPANKIFIDYLTDSGTTAMSDKQWGALMLGDESYGSSTSWFKLEETLKDLFGYKHVLPAHQGRGAENIVFQVMIKEGQFVPNNMHFSPDRIKNAGGILKNLIIDEGMKVQSDHPFKGNMDIKKLVDLIETEGVENIAFVEITVTCNNAGGQPVSMQNLRDIREVANKYGLPVVMDSARICENAYFIKIREEGYADKSIKEIIREMCSYSDACAVSSKKDGMVNIGGFVGVNDDELYEKMQSICLMREGYSTYGGMAGRDLEALAVGYIEGSDENYLKYRIEHSTYLGEQLQKEGVPICTPVGGHGVWIDCQKFAPHIPQEQYPGLAITTAMYEEGGIRACELGSLAFSTRDEETGEILELPEIDLVRLAIPRRVYSYRHLDYTAAVIGEIYRNRQKLGGYKVEKFPYIKYRTVFLGEMAPINE
jgi:tryptophanase